MNPQKPSRTRIFKFSLILALILGLSLAGNAQTNNASTRISDTLSLKKGTETDNTTKSTVQTKKKQSFSW